MLYAPWCKDKKGDAMKIDSTIEEINKIANRAYAGAEPADRLAFECGMLTSALKEMSYLLECVEERCKELEIELTYKETL